MPRWQKFHVAACAFVVAYGLAYAAVDYLRVPRAFYDPRARVWFLAARAPGPVPAGYVGLWLWALALGAAAFGATYVVASRRRRPVGPSGLGLAAAWALTAVALAASYHTWQNWP